MEKVMAWSDVERELEKLDFPNAQDDVIVWGAGLMGQMETPVLESDIHVTAFCDTNQDKQVSGILGYPCIAPEQIPAYQKPFVLVSTLINYGSIKPQLVSIDVGHCTVDAYVIHRHLGEFRRVRDSLDEKSQRIYTQVLHSRLMGDVVRLGEICEDNQYFALPQFRFCNSDEVFVDCGAFVGDVVQKFIENSMGLFKKIYAFEPNGTALAAMERRIRGLSDIWLFERDQVICERKGVGKESSEVQFYSNPDNAANCSVQEHSGAREVIEIVSLDQYFERHEESGVTFLKADIEGFEWDMLLGAKEIIRRNRPKLAISIYHNIFDFYRIPLFLKELVPEYQFSVRHHWSNFNETILYCYL